MQPRAWTQRADRQVTGRETLLQFDFGEVFMGHHLPLTHIMMIVVMMMLFTVGSTWSGLLLVHVLVR